MIKLNAKQLRTTSVDIEKAKQIKRNPIYIVLDNVLDTYNIGSIFRLADAIVAKEVIICGDSEVPPNTRIKKASINTTEWVPWHYEKTAKEALEKLKKEVKDLKVVSVEQSKKSIPYTKAEWNFPLAVVVGNETSGVSKEVLEMSDLVVELPMFGVNISLNVMVSLGIVLYKVVENIL